MRKILWILCVFLMSFMIIGCGNKIGDEEKEKLSVNLDKYQLECKDASICDTINGKISKIVWYDGFVNSEFYDQMILTKDGQIYLYESLYGEILKVNGSLNNIDKIIWTNGDYYNPLIDSDKKYYTISKDGVVENIDFGIGNDVFLTNSSDNAIWVLNESNILNLYVSCAENKSKLPADKCPSVESYVKMVPTSGDILNWKVKAANSKVFVTEDNNVYPMSMLMVRLDFDNLTFELTNGDNLDDEILLNNVSGVWHVSNGESITSDNLLVQVDDNTLYYNWNSFEYDLDSNKYSFANKISFDEEVLDVLFSADDSCFLIIGKTKVYLAVSKDDDNYDLKNISELVQYKNDIKSLYESAGDVYVLLSDGNLYEIYSE